MANIHKVKIQKEFCVTFNQSAQDPNLSFAAKGLLWYLQSLPDDWEIKRSHLCDVYKGDTRGNGKEAIDRMMNELIESQYIVYVRTRNEQGRWVHRYDAYPIPLPEFQKMFPEQVKPSMDSPEPVKPATVNPSLIQRTQLTKNTKTKKEEQESQTADAAQRLARFLFSKIKELDPKAKEPSLDKWVPDIEKLIRLDGRDEEEISAVISWAFEDGFWSKNILSGRKLREKFEKLVISKKAAKRTKRQIEEEATDKKQAIIQENQMWAHEWLHTYKPGNMKIFANRIVISTPKGDAPIGFLEDDFKKTIVYWTKNQYPMQRG